MFLLGIALIGLAIYSLKKKGRSGALWYAYAIFLPPIALIHSLIMEDVNSKRCPYCLERINKYAVVCPHCQRDLQPATPPPMPPVQQPQPKAPVKHDTGVDLNNIPQNFENK